MGPGLTSSTAVSAEREFCRNAMEALRGSFPGFCFSWTLLVVPRFDAGICTWNELTSRGLLSVLAMSSVDGFLQTCLWLWFHGSRKPPAACNFWQTWTLQRHLKVQLRTSTTAVVPHRSEYFVVACLVLPLGALQPWTASCGCVLCG